MKSFYGNTSIFYNIRTIGGGTIGPGFDKKEPIALKFSSDKYFTLSVNEPSWDGTIEYSINKGGKWNTWDGSLLSGAKNQAVYLRGINNTIISNGNSWSFTGKYITGNIELLLDYQTVENHQHPTMGDCCYQRMFSNCTSLVSAPQLPAETLTYACYNGMFSSCSSLIAAPLLNATTLTQFCYTSMFYDCTALTIPPQLPATILTENCYSNMFEGCTSLTTAPELPATILADNCYYSMFRGCTLLTTAPELSAITLAYSCYNSMFEDCALLTVAPQLPATTLTEDCYYGMFSRCSSLIQIPALPATTLTYECYYYMFSGCSSLKFSSEKTEECPFAYVIPIDGTGVSAEDALTDMFFGTGGTFTGTPEINTIYYTNQKWEGYDKWVAQQYSLQFSSDSAFTLSVANPLWNNIIEYSIDGTETWTTWNGNQLTGTADQSIYLRGIGNNIITGIDNNAWTFTGKYITGDIETLLDYQTVINNEHPVMGTGCYYSMFKSCATLVKPPELSATTLTESCYRSMFDKCSSLTYSPKLPATILQPNCYRSMFYENTSLIETPQLPATTLAEACYQYLCYGCTSLTTLPELPATTLTPSCYYHMFEKCMSIKVSTTKTNIYQYEYRLPSLNTGTVSTNSLADMFKTTGGNFKGSPSINTTYYTDQKWEGYDEWLKQYCLKFSSDEPFTLSVATPGWLAVSNPGYIQYSVDNGTSWSTWNGSELSGTATQPIYLRGTNNTKITGSIDARYNWRFTGKYCTGNIETLLDYQTIINGQSPTMGDKCYARMFSTCNTLITAPELPATTLAESCYTNMFYGCTSLTTAPELPAEKLANRCYGNMFFGCTSLITAPELPATTLAEICYAGMFNSCTSLITLPELPATILTTSCYSGMFYSCTSLKLSTTKTGAYQYPYRIPTSDTGTTTSYALDNMFTNTGGTFIGTPSINTIYYTDHKWEGYDEWVLEQTALKFSSDEPFTLSVTTPGWNGTIEYTVDKGNTWNIWDGNELSGTAIQPIYLRGTGNTVITGPSYKYSWTFTGKYCIGNIEKLLDYQTVINGQHPTMNEDCYCQMFIYCSHLITPPELPATTLSSGCYSHMFTYCSSLTTAPELPATTLANYCYYEMFEHCTSLIVAPQLPATTLTEDCYRGMFTYCSSLTTVPQLPATTLTNYCYYEMFSNCRSLKISTTRDSTTYKYEYRIPISGTGTTATRALDNMFFSTGGTFKSTPSINTTYYTNNQPV